jgi:hypothetical protein
MNRTLHQLRKHLLLLGFFGGLLVLGIFQVNRPRDGFKPGARSPEPSPGAAPATHEKTSPTIGQASDLARSEHDGKLFLHPDPEDAIEVPTEDPYLRRFVNAAGETTRLLRLNSAGDTIQEIQFENDQIQTINRSYDGARNLLREDVLLNDQLIERKTFR